jgi:hypothetical protein
MIRGIGPNFCRGRWTAPLVAVFLATLWTSPIKAQPVLDMTAPRKTVVEKKPPARPNPAAAPALPAAGITLPEAPLAIENFRFVAPWEITSAEGKSRPSELASTPAQDFTDLGDWTTWGRFALDLSGVTQALLLRDALLRVQSIPPLQYQPGVAACHAVPPVEHSVLPPLALTLVPLAATPLVGLVLLRLRHAIEPHLQARLARRRKRRPGQSWLSAAKAHKRVRRRHRRSRRERRRVRFEARSDSHEGGG